jgi:hypothetical protein
MTFETSNSGASNANITPVEYGQHYILGYLGDSYGIWEKKPTNEPGERYATMLMTEENWGNIWNQFKSWEAAREEAVKSQNTSQNMASSQQIPANSETTDVRLPGMSRAPKIAPGSAWSVSASERVEGLTDRYGRPNPVIVKRDQSLNNKKVRKKIQPAAYVSFTLALIEVGVRVYLFIESKKSVSLRIPGHIFFALQVSTYLLSVIGFVTGLSARKRILNSDGRRAGYAVAWVGIILCWILALISLGLDIYPQIHSLIYGQS